MIETTKKDSAIGRFPANAANENVLIIRIGNGTKTFETHSIIHISENSQYKVVISDNTTKSITPYYEDSDIFSFFMKQNENFNWKIDCKDGRLPSYICNFH